MDKFWAGVAVTIGIGGVGVWMKISDGSLKNKKAWGMLGTALILTAITMLGMFALGVQVQFRLPIVFGDEQIQEANAQFPKWPDPYRPISVINQTFRNVEVRLDGYAYDHCIFENVTFVYDGTTPLQVTFATVRGSPTIRSNNLAVTGTVFLLKGFGLLKPNMKLDIKGENPSIVIKEPGESVQ